MNEKQHAEVAFWSGLYDQLGPDGFVKRRQEDLEIKTGHFPELAEEDGWGLDLGCGLLSIFEFSDLTVVAVDPLLDEYRMIYEVQGAKVPYFDSTHLLGETSQDFVFCVNVIDHTPDPAELMREILRVLKPGGRLYFQVNFDTEVTAPHWHRWDLGLVQQHVARHLNLRRAEVCPGEYPGQLHFWGVFTK